MSQTRSSHAHAHPPTSSSSNNYHNHQSHYRPFHYPSSSAASTPSRHHNTDTAPVSPLLPSERFRRPSIGTATAHSHAYDAYNLAHTDPFVSPIMSRTPSVAGSDRYSTVSGVTGYWPQNPDNVKPDAAYVAPFGAVQVVNEHRAAGRRSESSDDETDESPEGKDDASFSPQALALINHFLDQLLYSFLSTARSTNLQALRPAVTEVLRHRLAKEAVSNADEELQELLAGGEEEDERNAQSQLSSTENNRKWDLELVWKRTRLRVMVYMRLGEMEDDDEERFVKEQELFYGRELDSRRFSSSSGLVSWSAAIFLTSVLEYIAEQSLQAAGSVAHARARRQHRTAERNENKLPSDSKNVHVSVEDFDVEKLALDARLGRLWRTWRKTLRNDRQRPMTPAGRGVGGARSSFSYGRDRAVSLGALRRGSAAGYAHSRDDSNATMFHEERYGRYGGMHARQDDDPEAQYPEHVLASNIPLPMRDAKRDVDEIEMPGLAKSSTEDDTEGSESARRNSYGRHQNTGWLPNGYFNNRPATAVPAERPQVARQRSKSVPEHVRTPGLEIPGAFPVVAEDAVEQKASVVDMQDAKLEREAVVDDGADEVAADVRDDAPAAENDLGHAREESKVLLNDDFGASRKMDAQGRVDLPREIEPQAQAQRQQAGGDEVRPFPVRTDSLPPAQDPSSAANASTGEIEDHTPEPLRSDELPPPATDDRHTENHHSGLLAGVAAGATAVAGAAVAAVGLSHDKDEDKSRREDVPQQSVEVPEHEQDSTAHLPPPRKRSSAEIRDLDRKKSLVDLKAGMRSRSASRSREASGPRVPETVQTGTAAPALQPSPEIQDVDRRKSLVDDKAFMASRSAPRSREASRSRVPEPLVAVAASSAADPLAADASPISPKTLRDPAQRSVEPATIAAMAYAAPRNADPVAMAALEGDVPRRNDHIAAVAPEESASSSRVDPSSLAALEAPAAASANNEDDELKARDMPMLGLPRAAEKPGRLVITGDSPLAQTKASPLTVQTELDNRQNDQLAQSTGSPKSPRTYLGSRDQSLNSEFPPPPSRDASRGMPSEKTRTPAPRPQSMAISPNEQTRASAPRSVASAATPVSPMTPSVDDKPKESRAWPSATEQRNSESPRTRSIYSVHQKQSSRGEVQNHPTIQGKGTPKKEPAVLATPSSGTRTPPVMTSASIRGPQDFDNFLQGDDTVKYTLTPETVRGEPSRPPTGDGKFLAKKTSDPASLAKLSGQASEGAQRKNSSPAPSSRRGLRKNSSPAPSSQRQSRASRSQSIKDVTSAQPVQDAEPTRERRRSVSKPPPRNTSTHRKSGLMAREPQVLTASTRDFADFIRSTGPDREPEIQRLSTSKSATSLHSVRNSNARSQSVGAASLNNGERERTKSLTHATMAEENIPPVPRMPAGDSARNSRAAAPGSSLQARSATGAASGNKDLINFIRDGPEEEGSHRISRSVAPFRNTMDSDQFGDMGGDFGAPRKQTADAVQPPSAKPTTATATPAPSSTANHAAHPSHSTSNSQSHLLGATTSNTAPADGDLTRKRYRNKDPYAIPSDSEDDEEDEADFLTALPRKNQRPKEESLVDFLRNNEPPSNNAPRPISTSKPSGASNGNGSGNGNGSVVVNSVAYPNNSSNLHAVRPPQQQQQQQQYQHQYNQQTQDPDPSSTKPPQQPQPSGPIPVSAPSTGPKLEARAPARRNIPRGNAGARLGANQQTSTGDLADFLRSSGPLEDSRPGGGGGGIGGAPAPFIGRRELDEPPVSPVKKRKGFFGMFGGRK